MSSIYRWTLLKRQKEKHRVQKELGLMKKQVFVCPKL